VAVDVKAFASLNDSQRKSLGGTPQYLAFKRVIGELVEYYKGRDEQLSVICDDDQQCSPQYYRILNELRHQSRPFRKTIVSLCFADDKHFSPLQASDMIAYLVRTEAERRFHQKEDRTFGGLLQQLASPPSGPPLEMLGGYFGDAEIASLVSKFKL
jgi:hypothetical protein